MNLIPYKAPVGNAVWPEKKLMFVTYESSSVIAWASTSTMKKIGEINIGVSVFGGAGIACDTVNELIYIANRNSDDLYVYSYDEHNNTLVFDNHYDLAIPSGNLDAWGISLDEINGLLYVSTNTNTVHVYDTNSWDHDHSIDVTVDGNDRFTLGIAVDPVNEYLYTGHYSIHNYLVRTDINHPDPNSPYTSTEVKITREGYPSKEVIGIDVDEETGYVYVTTYHHDFRVYDSDLVLHDTERNPNISGPGGVAVGSRYKYSYFDIVKDANGARCAEPLISDAAVQIFGADYNWLYYKISWDANGYADSNVFVVDHLPREVDYNDCSDGGRYDANAHTVTWDLNSIGSSETGDLEIRVGVNNWAKPGHSFSNLVVIEGDTYIYENTFDVNVCCWGGDANNTIIYVDKDANNGFDNGTSWVNAYTSLQDAFTTARSCPDKERIWVAGGTYKPVWDVTQDESFELIDGVGLFGHFGDDERSVSERNFTDSSNVTVLEGQIGGSAEKVDDVVTAYGIVGANVDGFTIRGGVVAGISLYDANVGIVNCKIEDNGRGVILSSNSYADIYNCIFRDNVWDGVKSSGSELVVSYCVFDGNNSTTDKGLDIYDSNVEVENCVVQNHYLHGIYASFSYIDIKKVLIENSGGCGIYSFSDIELAVDHSVIRNSGYAGIESVYDYSANITNCWIHNNGASSSGAGIFYYAYDVPVVVRNNTIYDNNSYGIEVEEIDSSFDPNILNCIIYGNGISDLYRDSGSFDTVNYCNLQSYPGGTGNIFSDPCFMNILSDANDLHIDGDSNCIDAGIPDANYGDETDIDGEVRIEYGRVDIGADEYYWSAADFDESGIVNFLDYAVIAGAWMTDFGDANYVPKCDLEDNNSIDYNDIGLFCDEWLWESPVIGGWAMGMGGGGGFRGMSMMESLSLEGVCLAGEGGGLMLSAIESQERMPERLAVRSGKFYDVRAASIVSVREELDADVVNELLEWLDKMWLDGEFDKYVSEKEYWALRAVMDDFWRY